MIDEVNSDILDIVSVMLDDIVFSGEAYNIEHTIYENARYCGVWWKERHWNLGVLIPWPTDYLALHVSINGGNVRHTFWKECVSPLAEQYIGSIFVVNASRPELFHTIKTQLAQYQWMGVTGNLVSVSPMLAITKYDDPSAWEPEDIALYLRDVAPNAPFCRVDPQDWNSVKNLLITSCAYFANFL